jgi:hypothetical protein
MIEILVCGTSFILELFLPMFDCIGSVMVSVLTSSAVDRRFESRSDKTTRLAWNQDNVSDWSDMSTR